MFYDKFVHLCNQKNVSPSKAAIDAGISKSLVTKWRTNKVKTPSAEVIDKLSAYFGVSVSDLLSEDIGVYAHCAGCGLQYDPNDEEDCETHDKRHNLWLAATHKFGFCWNYLYRENKKANARAIVNNPNLPLNNRIEAQTIVFKALFSRSLEAFEYDLDHPNFETYIAMMLNQGEGSMPPEVYSAMVKKYGRENGILTGTYYLGNKKAPTQESERCVPGRNILRLAGRDGSFIEKQLSDEQLSLVKALIEQLPEVTEL